MTLSGAVAKLRPDIDELAVTPVPLVAHRRVRIGKTSRTRRLTVGNNAPGGTVDKTSGVYTAHVNAMTEAERRAAGLRRNGQPRRRAR